MQTEIFFSQCLVFSGVLLNPRPGSQIGADFQADFARFLRSKADLPQGRLPLKRDVTTKSFQPFQNICISAIQQGKCPSSSASVTVPKYWMESGSYSFQILTFFFFKLTHADIQYFVLLFG